MGTSLRTDLQELEQQLILMGQLVTAAIENATLALSTGDLALAQKVVDGDDEIDHLQKQIEMRSLQLMALQQPMARDLRYMATGLKLVTDLERIADHGVDIAKITLSLGGEALIKPLIDIPAMAVKAHEMIHEALAAFVTRDGDRARAMIELDHGIDHLYSKVFDELLDIMQEEPAAVRQAVYLLQVATYLERVGDHATNLGEWTLYLLTGELADLNN
ncbi:MAG: phosphate signaling complex protein PhoU [Mycobacterium leprae]